ncbi:hypothetical protein KY289_030727 [Solanum tuberosum]|nr:hypothetical protein KY289_030727 [Solanum tuberosum]
MCGKGPSNRYYPVNGDSRIVRVEVWQGSYKAAVIIPELSFNSGWSDVAEKILWFLGNNIQAQFPPPGPMTKSYAAAASIESWPEINQTANPGNTLEAHPLYRSLVGTLNDPFHHSPNHEILHKWFQSRWRVTTGFKVIPLDHHRFLFELPSRQEAARVKEGDWFWNGRHLSFDWWSLSITSTQSLRSENTWIKVFGIPLNAWSTDTFQQIGDRCGGYIGVDEDTKERTHFFWARVCVRNSGNQIPASLNFDLQGWKFELSIVREIQCPPNIHWILE